MKSNEFEILEEISIFQNYEIIALLYLTIPNDKTLNVYFQLIDDTSTEFYYNSNLFDNKFSIKAEYAKIISYSKTNKIEYIMYYPDGLFYRYYIEKRFYHKSGTYIKYSISTNTYIFVDSKSTHTLEMLMVF
ncbi:18633_t:CDS:2 [Dentiscutata erythropus]|uniref:18633_t:CDS:1 n=1 Tax=Dentiscutata erythropus TaxID=1348616 RepID=A0A9N9BN90_9GLOM|nr:18633_t:CDS:2 [Dentiscutata erythropus]